MIFTFVELIFDPRKFRIVIYTEEPHRTLFASAVTVIEEAVEFFETHHSVVCYSIFYGLSIAEFRSGDILPYWLLGQFPSVEGNSKVSPERKSDRYIIRIV